MTIGSRVAAISHADEQTVYLYGYGIYCGDEVPPFGNLHKLGWKNPMIRLDSGDVVWGHMCWWGSEEVIRKAIGTKEVIIVPVPTESTEEQTNDADA